MYDHGLATVALSDYRLWWVSVGDRPMLLYRLREMR